MNWFIDYEYNESITAWLPLAYSLPPCIPHKIRFKCRLKWMRIFFGGIFFFFFLPYPLRLCQRQLKSSKSNPVNRLLPGQLNWTADRTISCCRADQDPGPNRTVPYRTNDYKCDKCLSAVASAALLLANDELDTLHTHTHSTHTDSLTYSLDRMSPGNSSWLSIIR